MFYGVVHDDEPRLHAQAVCDVLGHGESGLAVRMLLETCAQETHLGRLRDASVHSHGVGLYQVDEVAFCDVKQRARAADVLKLEQVFGVVVGRVSYDALAFSPLLSTIWARLFYKLVPAVFPASIEGRAAYWKLHYNTPSGKGSVTNYVANAKRFLT